MANVKMEEFLLQYFMQLRFNSMPAEVRAQFDSYAKADDFRGNMKHWKSHLMEQDASGKWVQKSLPDPNGPDYHLEDKEWEKLFKEFQKAFRTLNVNRKKYTSSVDFGIDNSKVTAFLDEYFGDGKMFGEVTATPQAESQIQQLLTLLNNNHSLFTVKLSEWGVISYKDLVDGIKDKKYNTDSDFQDKLKVIAQYLNYYKPELAQNIPNINNLDCEAIEKGFDGGAIDHNKLNAFKTEYDLLLRKLNGDSKLFDAFPSDKIRSAYDKAKQYVAYDDQNSKDYVPPKRDDELTLPQQISQWAGNTYAETLEKYLKFKGDRMYFSPQAKQIVGAIHKAKIKPTDGLKAVLDKSGEIKKGLQYKSPQATDHFDWFVKTMGELQSTMPKAFEGALYNGRQMRALIEEMILIAVRDGKDKEAKTAMEVMSVIKYGYTTSKIMDALKKEDLSIFSDSKLSWNKNEGMQMVTKALDKSIRAAFLGIGYGITMVGNAIHLSGSKFRGKSKRISKAHKDFEQQSLIQHQNIEQQQAADQQLQDANNETLRDLNALHGINDTTIGTHRTNLEQSQQRQNQYQQLVDQAKQQQTELPIEIANLDTEINNQRANEANVNAEIAQINSRIAWLNTEIANPATPPAVATAYQVELNDLQNNKLPAKTQLLTQIQDTITDKQNDRNRKNNRLTNLPNIINRLEQSVHQQSVANNRNELRLNAWTDAKSTVDFLESRINSRNQILQDWDDNHKDKYKALMAYWDMLETGRDSHMGKMYNWLPRKASSAQKSFDTKKDAFIQSKLNNYNYMD